MLKKILLTGGAGNLGKAILSLPSASSFLAPSRSILDITKPDTIKSFFEKNQFDAVIHCAALARMKECHENPAKTIEANIVGTANLVAEAINKENKTGKSIRFVHISTDGVYEGTKGNYSENDAAIPYNFYGWTKLGAECSVKLLKNHCIIRTSFFDPKNIKFNESAVDAYSSKVTINYLAKSIIAMLGKDFIGTVNIGSERKSDYEHYKPYKPELKKCRFEDIQKSVPFRLTKDSSMNISLWNKIKNKKRANK